MLLSTVAVCRVWYLAWLALAAMLGVPYALQASRGREPYSAALQPTSRPVPLLMRPVRRTAVALCDMAACPLVWWPQVRSTHSPYGSWLSAAQCYSLPSIHNCKVACPRYIS